MFALMFFFQNYGVNAIDVEGKEGGMGLFSCPTPSDPCMYRAEDKNKGVRDGNEGECKEKRRQRRRPERVGGKSHFQKRHPTGINCNSCENTTCHPCTLFPHPCAFSII